MATVSTHSRSRATSARKAAVSDMGVVTSLVWRGGRDSVNGSQLLATPPSPEDEVCIYHTPLLGVVGGLTNVPLPPRTAGPTPLRSRLRR